MKMRHGGWLQRHWTWAWNAIGKVRVEVMVADVIMQPLGTWNVFG